MATGIVGFIIDGSVSDFTGLQKRVLYVLVAPQNTAKPRKKQEYYKNTVR